MKLEAKHGFADGSTVQHSRLSTSETAQRLGMTARSVFGFIERGELPAYRIGRVIRIKPGKQVAQP